MASNTHRMPMTEQHLNCLDSERTETADRCSTMFGIYVLNVDFVPCMLHVQLSHTHTEANQHFCFHFSLAKYFTIFFFVFLQFVNETNGHDRSKAAQMGKNLVHSTWIVNPNFAYDHWSVRQLNFISAFRSLMFARTHQNGVSCCDGTYR